MRSSARIDLLVLLALAACGVQEHPIDQTPSGSPFGGGSGASSTGNPGSGSSTSSGTGAGSGSGSGSGSASASGSGATSQGDGSAPSTQDGSPTTAGDASHDAAPIVLSGITININGTQVPKERVIAFIHFGHSNMAGRGDAPLPLRPFFFTQADPRAWLFRNGAFQPALEPNTAGDGGNNTLLVPGQTLPLGGPGTALVKQAAAMAPSSYFVSLGFGRSSAFCSQFLPGHLYYDSVVAAAKQLKGKVTFGGIVVMLGITERHGTAADITGYPSCMNTLVTAIRTDVGEPNLPLLLTDYEMTATGSLAPTVPFALSIIPQIHMVPSVVSNSAIVPTDGLPLADAQVDGGHHFNLDGHKMWTQRALDIMKAKGWFPWQ
jgi:hypothetical protein